MMPPTVWGDLVWCVVLWLSSVLDEETLHNRRPHAQMVMVYYRAIARFLPCGDCTKDFLLHLQATFRPAQQIWPANYMNWAIDLRTQIAEKHKRRIRSREECYVDLRNPEWRKKFWTGLMMMAFSAVQPLPVELQNDFKALMDFVSTHYPWHVGLGSVGTGTGTGTGMQATALIVTGVGIEQNIETEPAPKPWWTSREGLMNLVWKLAVLESRSGFKWYDSQEEWIVDLQTRVNEVIKALSQTTNPPAAKVQTHEAVPPQTTVKVGTMSALNLPSIAKPPEIPADMALDGLVEAKETGSRAETMTEPPLIDVKKMMLEQKRDALAKERALQQRREAAKAVPHPFRPPDFESIEHNQRRNDAFPGVKPSAVQQQQLGDDIPTGNPVGADGQPILKGGTTPVEYQNQQAQAARTTTFNIFLGFLVVIGSIAVLAFLFFFVVRRVYAIAATTTTITTLEENAEKEKAKEREKDQQESQDRTESALPELVVGAV